MTHSESYSLGGTQTELRRLLAQAEGYVPESNWLLDQCGIRPGWRTVDFGCGPIGILNLLSQRVGPHGSVVGLEREPLFAEMARAETARRGLSNVRIVQADAVNTGLEKNAYDLVHARLVLINVSARDAFLAEMLSLLRPGGTLALADLDCVSWLCHPPHPSWDVLLNAFLTVFHAGGGDEFIGRRLPALLRGAGVQNVRINVTLATPNPGDYYRTHLTSMIDSVRDKITASGALDESELDEHREALLCHLNDPSTVVIGQLFVQSWGQKPGWCRT